MHSSKSTPFSPNRVRPWLWANLLSLDAPIVAILWQQLFSRSLNVPTTAAAAVTLAAAVWLIYASDRVLDAAREPGHSARHRFYRRHWRSVVPALLVALLLAGWLALTGIRKPVFYNGLAMLALVALYFAAVHLAPQFIRSFWPKEMVVALIFSVGTCIPVWTFAPYALWAAPLALFAALCWINCAAIAYWETDALHPSTRWIGAHLGPISLVLAAAATILALSTPAPASRLYLSEALSAIAFMLLARFSSELSHDGLRVAADAVLCTPLLFLPFAAFT
ncbi:MAG: hypothetical protein ABJF23_25775 [Bryobacteraceae bacterium]